MTVRGLFRFDTNIGTVEKDFKALEKFYVDGRRMFVALSDEGKTSGYFSPAAGAILVHLIKDEINNSSISQPDYSESYKKWKKGSAYSGKSFWFRTGAIGKSVIYTRSSGYKGMIGFDKRMKTERIGFGKGDYRQDSSKYSIEKVASMLEFGSTGKYGMPARPVFSPMTKIFLSNSFPKLVDRTQKILEDLFESRLNKEIQETPQVSAEVDIFMAMFKAIGDGKSIDVYQEALKNVGKS